MKEIELSDDLPQDAVDKAFEDLEEQLQSEDLDNQPHLNIIKNARLITVNNDDELAGMAKTTVEMAISDWIDESGIDLTHEDIEHYHQSNSVTFRTV
jgi:response regulator of citrate/malate metabolism